MQIDVRILIYSCFSTVLLGETICLFRDAVDTQYTFESTVRLNEVSKINSINDLVFRTVGNALLSVLWQNPADQDDKILHVRVSIVFGPRARKFVIPLHIFLS